MSRIWLDDPDREEFIETTDFISWPASYVRMDISWFAEKCRRFNKSPMSIIVESSYKVRYLFLREPFK